jgi:hypothetical protein
VQDLIVPYDVKSAQLFASGRGLDVILDARTGVASALRLAFAAALGYAANDTFVAGLGDARGYGTVSRDSAINMPISSTDSTRRRLSEHGPIFANNSRVYVPGNDTFRLELGVSVDVRLGEAMRRLDAAMWSGSDSLLVSSLVRNLTAICKSFDPAIPVPGVLAVALTLSEDESLLSGWTGLFVATVESVPLLIQFAAGIVGPDGSPNISVRIAVDKIRIGPAPAGSLEVSSAASWPAVAASDASVAGALAGALAFLTVGVLIFRRAAARRATKRDVAAAPTIRMKRIFFHAVPMAQSSPYEQQAVVLSDVNPLWAQTSRERPVGVQELSSSSSASPLEPVDSLSVVYSLPDEETTVVFGGVNPLWSAQHPERPPVAPPPASHDSANTFRRPRVDG